MKGYKVVRKIEGKEDYYSFASMGPSGTRRYRIGLMTWPHYEGGPLCVFEDLSHATRFCIDTTIYAGLDIHIFECEYQPSIENFVWTEGSRVYHVRSLPPGTRLADFVTLKKEVAILKMEVIP